MKAIVLTAVLTLYSFQAFGDVAKCVVKAPREQKTFTRSFTSGPEVAPREPLFSLSSTEFYFIFTDIRDAKGNVVAKDAMEIFQLFGEKLLRIVSDGNHVSYTDPQRDISITCVRK